MLPMKMQRRTMRATFGLDRILMDIQSVIQGVDLKSMLVTSVLGLMAGGGLYGLYVKTLAPAAHGQLMGYGALTECVELKLSSDTERIRTFVKTIDAQVKDLRKAEVVAYSVIAATSDSRSPTDAAGSLEKCAGDLKKKLPPGS